MEEPQDDPVTAYLKTKQKPAAGDDPVAAYLAVKQKATRSAPTGHNGVPFVDAKPEPETPGDRVAGLVAAVNNGVSFGQGSRVAAVLRAIATPSSPLSTYRDAKQENDAVLEQHQSNHPLEAAGEELAGSIPTLMESGIPRGVGKGAVAAAKAVRHPVLALRTLGRAGVRAAGDVADVVGTIGAEGTIPAEALTSEGSAAFRPIRPAPIRARLSELGTPAAVADATEEAASPLARTRHPTRARMNADAERMGLPVGPPPPQGALRAPDAVDDGGDLLDLLRRSVEMAKAKRVP